MGSGYPKGYPLYFVHCAAPHRHRVFNVLKVLKVFKDPKVFYSHFLSVPAAGEPFLCYPPPKSPSREGDLTVYRIFKVLKVLKDFKDPNDFFLQPHPLISTDESP